MSTSAHTPRGLYGLLGAAVAVLALAGCGSSASTTSEATTQPTATQAGDPSSSGSSAKTSASSNGSAKSSGESAKTSGKGKGETVPNVDLVLKSSVPLEPISSHYTCDGANVPPPLSWGKVPAGTSEIDLFVARLKGNGNKLFLDWGVAGLKPSLTQFSGKLPAGAIIGRNSLGTIGYSLCPAKGSEEEYIAFVDALKAPMPMKSGFSAATLLERILHTEASEGRASIVYKRP